MTTTNIPLQDIYLKAIGEGISLGFGLAFLIGPAFFALLQASIDHGFGVSVALAFGIVCSDILLMILTYSLMAKLNQIPHFNEGLAIVGGIVLSYSGLAAIFSVNKPVQKMTISIKEIWSLFLKGFSINTFNPFPWMFWLSTSAMVNDSFNKFGWIPAVLFFGFAAFTVFTTDVLKAWAAQFLLMYLTDKILRRFKTLSGVCLIGFGLRLFYFAFEIYTKN